MIRKLNRCAAVLSAIVFLVARPAPALSSPAQATLLADASYSGALKERIRGAQRRIICAFYLFKATDRRGNLPAAIAQDLAQARARGVEVTVILEGEDSVGRDNRAAAGYLARKGVRVRFTRDRRTTHAKAVVIDDRFVIIGSHNLSHAALTRNRELSVLLDAPELAAQVTRYLEGIR
ncbi:phospholipase [Geomonas sp. Red69]|uniref:phospholipase D n=1 Tax=Geomonas diazotrophica TaxID=2843197 RepID=A0ABX8JGX4_9BACT|nr:MULTISPECIES: phospholipase D-like domain-containing protein [Geomonas]MBU5635967.1 phospholipase [Geomonas diazotrophica]QWV96854.1 phospholipase [Geomonas nitrogeniifigens]QXE86019.1 phospholipase [Geomonas nitrogeniifigens]